MVGGASLLLLSAAVVHHANDHLQSIGSRPSCREGSRVQVFYRAEKYGTVFYSVKYTRVKIRNSYTVTYTGRSGETKYGLIQYFFVSDTSILPLVVVKVLERCTVSLQDNFNVTDSNVNQLTPFLVPVRESDECDVTDLGNIQEKCLYITFPSEFTDKYIIRFPHKMHD